MKKKQTKDNIAHLGDKFYDAGFEIGVETIERIDAVRPRNGYDAEMMNGLLTAIISAHFYAAPSMGAAEGVLAIAIMNAHDATTGMEEEKKRRGKKNDPE